MAYNVLLDNNMQLLEFFFNIQTRFYEGSSSIAIVHGCIQTLLSPINLCLAFSTDLELAEMFL